MKLTHTWGLGGSALVLVLIQIVTGILLVFAYTPTPEAAYSSIVSLQRHLLFGQLIRNLHYWASNLLVLVVFFHLLRVFLTGAYNEARRSNWWIGLGLFSSVLIANLTGYLLPLDQLSYWAITICTSLFDYIPLIGPGIQHVILGGPEIGEATLANFFAIHVAVIPALLVVLLTFHFWKVRKAGGVVVPPSGEKDSPKIPSVPHLLTREIAAATAIIASLLVVSIFFDAPLSDKANPGLSPNPTKAPWYFSGLQELLQHFHPTVAVFVIPLLCGALLILVPYLRFEKNHAGIWFLSGTGRRTSLVAAACALVLVPGAIILDEYFIDADELLPSWPPVVSSGFLPLAAILVFLFALYKTSRRRFLATRGEAAQAVFVFLTAAFVVLTMTGLWFRGPGMALKFP